MKKKEIKNTEKTFALKVFTNGNFGCVELATVTITKELLERIKPLREKAKELKKLTPNFYVIEIFDGSPSFIDHNIDTIEDLSELVEDEEIYDITGAEVLERLAEAELADIDATTLRIGIEGVSWSCIDNQEPNTSYDTREIFYKELGL